MRFFCLVFLLLFLSLNVQAASYDIYVDQSNDTGTEDGTEKNPFNTISEGIAKAMENEKNARRIWVAAGKYQEQVELKENVKLFGAGEEDVVIVGKNSLNDHFPWTVKMFDNSKIKNVGVRYGEEGILVTAGSSVEIEKCEVFNSKLNGIYVEKAKNSEEKFILKDSEVYDSEKRGIYVYKKKIEMKNNKIYDNKEEGLDLHSGVKGTLSGNKFFKNGESGVELELRNLDLKIDKNSFFSNKASGLNFQYRGKNKSGKIIMSGNKINKNSLYGIKCGIPSGGHPNFSFFSHAIDFSGNFFQKNRVAKFSEFCNF